MLLRKLIKLWRESEKKTVRAGAKEIGIDPTTLHRFEKGESLSSANLCKIIVWLLSSDGD